MARSAAAFLALIVLAGPLADAQSESRRFATIAALRQFAGYFHLQTVVLRGEIVEDGTALELRSDQEEMRVVLGDGVRAASGPVEVRGQLIDVGRLEPGDPRLPPAPAAGEREGERWPRPGEELFVRLTNVTDAQPVTSLTVRALALEPWRYDGQKVTVLGNFRGRNLFGDLPGAPAASPYDFVIRGAEGAVWVTGQRPRGRGFDLDVNRRVDSDRWLDVTGTVHYERGLVRIEATQLAAAKAPAVTVVAEEPAAPPLPPAPLEVVFSSPIDGEIDVMPAAPVRIQFSRGLDPKSVAGAIRVSYAGAQTDTPPPPFEAGYDAATRSITLKFGAPLERFRTVKIDVLETLKAFDGGIARPWSITFTVGG